MRDPRRSARWLLLVSLAGAGCAGKSPPADPPAPSGRRPDRTAPEVNTGEQRLYEHHLQPAALDPAADKYLAEEYAALDTRAPLAGKLVVYLVGANNKPQSGRPMMQELAAMGFHVLAPMYANPDIRPYCASDKDADEDCHAKFRLEAFEGTPQSPHLEVSRANSAEGRVVRMLAHLDKIQPGADWGFFLEGDRPRWSQIVIAGHSHGASSAGLIGKVRAVNRVVMLSGPFDNRGGQPAPWTRRPGLTPAERVYGFSHTLEEQHAGHLQDWDAMGLAALGPVVVVEAAAAPFGGSHQIVTSLPPMAGVNPHGMTAAGRASPQLPDGSYRFLPVFRYLFGR
jgi:hypothetical protein